MKRKREEEEEKENPESNKIQKLKKLNDIDQAANVLINLFKCINEGNISGVIQLINSGANVEAKNSNGLTALHHAARSGKVEAIEFLLKAGANISAKLYDGSNVLHLAAENDHVEVLKYLIPKLKEVSITVDTPDNYNWTSLHYAAKGGKVEAIEFLIEAGANIGAKLYDGNNILHLAAENDHVEVLKYLIPKLKDSGADLEIANNDGWTLLHYAAWTPLHLAAQNGDNKELAELLIAKGAYVEAKNNNSLTPLHLAAENGHQELAELLIARGADVEAKNNDGLTPLHLAAQRGHQELAELLNKNWRFLKEISQKSDQIMNFDPGEDPIKKKLSFFKIFQFVPKISLIRQLANQGYETDKIKSKIIEIEKYLLDNAINISGIVKNLGSTMLTFTIEENQCNNYKEQKEYYLKTQQRTGSIDNVKVIDAKPNNNSTESIEVSMFVPNEILNHIFSFLGNQSLANIHYNSSTQTDRSDISAIGDTFQSTD